MDGKLNTPVFSEALPKVKAKVFNCKGCGAPVTLRAVGLSQVCVCAGCGSIIDAKTEEFEIISKSTKKGHRLQVIALGTRGKIHGTLWEVIGYMERWDGRVFYWSEYLLFNPMKGFRWLAENNGHWSYVLITKEKPETNYAYGQLAKYSGHLYKLYHKGTAELVYVVGEFYWKAKIGEQVKVKDFIRENEILAVEETEKEMIWSVAEYLEAERVRQAFKIDHMPLQVGVAPNQPCPVSPVYQQVLKLWIFFSIALIMVQFFSMLSSSSNQVLKQDFSHTGTASVPLGSLPPDQGKSTQTFELGDEITNVQITLYSKPDNGWLYLQGELVNLESGEAYEFDQGVEAYSGYEDGYYWSEGNVQSISNLPAVPGGNYQINFESSSDKEQLDFRISVARDVPLWETFIWLLVLLSLFPVFMYWRRSTFNMKKWAESDYSPYASNDEDY
ncbi:MAG TPA: DUF4178 domain-containing protein [Bacteriovoracaceae bacterium]|nr:DUF4178 domain-containing protein [Bacteriovoracaceae bacterium]